MISYFEANLLKIALHHVGNPTQDEGYSLSDNPLDVTDETKRLLLMKYFLSPFEKSVEVFQFYHASALHLNSVYSLCAQIFTDNSVFQEASEVLAITLHKASLHPKIKSGDLYVVLFENIQIEGELLPAIGIFKSESKETYLKVNAGIGSMDVTYEQDAVNINNLDKGCLVFNTDAANGFKVAVIDKSNRNESTYWMDDFLKVQVRKDAYQDTANIMAVYKHFITDKLDDSLEVTNNDKVDLLNKGLKYFKEKEEFDLDEFAGEVIGNHEAITSFKDFKQTYQLDFDTPIADVFEISGSAVKKQARAYKQVIKLDKNFQINVTGSKELIERGFDNEKGLNYYKLYFKEEHL